MNADNDTPRTNFVCEKAWHGKSETLHFRQACALGDLARQLEREVNELTAALEVVARYAAAEINVPFDECISGPIGEARAALAKVKK